MNRNVLGMKPGDRVVLYCPEIDHRAMAVYDGTFQSMEEAVRRDAPNTAHLVCQICADWLNSGIPFARFTLRTGGVLSIVTAFRVDRDGHLTDPAGRAVLIEEQFAFTGRG
jgi:hypothetical protein